MAQDRVMVTEETLDPEDWESMRALGHRMIDDMLDYTRTLDQRPVWEHIPGKALTTRSVATDTLSNYDC